MSLSRPRYWCHACRIPQHSIRCGICGADCDDEGTPAPTQAVSDARQQMMKRRPATLLDIQTAISQWLYGRMLDEDPCTSLLHIARTSSVIWAHMTQPNAPQPAMLQTQALLADAYMLFGHHFGKPIAHC